MIRLAGDRDHIIRCNAAAVLGVLGDGRAAKPLLKLLKDKDPYVRGSAAGALPNLRGPKAVKPLLAALKDKDPWVRNIAIGSLGYQGGSKVVEVLMGMFNRQDKDTRDSVIGALGDAGAVQAVEALIEILKTEQHMGAAEALGKLGDARSVEPLIALLQDKSASEWLRYACAKALGKIGDRRALPILSEVAHDEGDKARYSAAEALGGMGPAAIPDLVAALRSQDWAVRRKAGDALNRLGVPSDPLTQAHYAAAQGLWERAIPLGETAVEPLLYVVDGENYEKVVNALCRIGALGVEALLSGLTGAEGWMSRKAAARALGTIRDQRAVGALKAALADKEERVRDEAQQALTKIT